MKNQEGSDPVNSISSSSTVQIPNTNMNVKLPLIVINTFYGDIEEFPSFWEHFQSFIDNDDSLLLVDTHVFLRGFLDDKAKRLV
ncbi:hypothetical protein TNCT_617661 [Trichonephila clavata]|uniref:Uncharacterized protein n=1 Tax=Trichonephila clavata TaxID=2740835 RepID=A0A8X6F114_TRICU|nr:hypothetical protein TNCT_617661 [Trichonephila clavata]